MKKNIKVSGILFLVAVIIILPQLAQHALILGPDALFHFNRFFDTEQQIAHGNLQYFITTYGFSQSGRIVNALYGPYIAYFNGFLLYILKSWFWYQIISSIFVCFISGVSMYYLLIRNKINYYYALFIAVLYMLTYGVTAWITTQQFIAWGAMLVPLGLAVATRLISAPQKPINVVEMSLVTTLFIQTHVLSSLILIFIYIIFFVISLFRVTDKYKLWRSLVVAIGITSLLTSNIWVILLAAYHGNHLMSPFLNLFPLKFGVINFPTDNKLLYPFAIIFILQIGTLFFKITNVSFLNRVVTILGAVLIICTLPILPWNYLFTHLPFISILQFPFRFFPFAEALLLLGFGLTLNNLTLAKPVNNISKLIMFIIATLSILLVQNLVYTASLNWSSPNNIIASKTNVSYILNGEKLRQRFYSKNLGAALKVIWKPTSDYLPVKQGAVILHPYNEYNMQIAKNTHNKKTATKTGLRVSWMATKENYHNTGVVKYANDRILINGQTPTKRQYYTTKIGTLMVRSSRGHNVVTITYKPSLSMRLGLLINLISWLIFGGYLLLLGLKKWPQKNAHHF